MTKTVLYAGPSLYGIDKSLTEGIRVKGPCKQSDLFEDIADDKVENIIVADGLYKNIPAPWHKEFLLTLEAGKRVIGVSSLGALRAAELDSFGVKGYGKVYEYFKSGIRDDSDVALLHMAEYEGWKPTTVAFVEVYFWLETLRESGTIDSQTFEILTEKQRSCYFEKRTWGYVRRELESLVGVDTAEKCIEMFVSQKKQDLEEVLHTHRLGELNSSDYSLNFDVSWTPYIPRQLTKDARVEEVSESGDHANTISNFTIFCFLRSPRAVHNLYIRTWTECLIDDLARISGKTQGEDCEVSSRLQRLQAISDIIRPEGRKMPRLRSIGSAKESEWLYNSIRRHKEIQSGKKLIEDYVEQEEAEEFIGTAIEWLKTVTSVRDEKICSHVYKGRFKQHIVDCICRGEDVSVENEERLFMLLEFFSGNVLFHSYGRNRLFGAIIKGSK